MTRARHAIFRRLPSIARISGGERWLPLLAIVLSLNALASADSGPRYWALFADGTQVAADRVVNWGEQGKAAMLGDRALFDPANPVRLLRNRNVSVTAAAGPRIELHNGDVLPGRVVEIHLARPEDGLPACAVVQLTSPFISHTDVVARLPVRLDAIRRIILTDDDPGDYQPNTVTLTDARRLTVEGLRWREGGMRVLTDAGMQNLAIEEIANVDLPAPDPIGTLLSQNAGPGVSADTLVGRLRTGNGAALTFRTDMLRAYTVWPNTQQQTACVQLQPWWALEAVAVPIADIAVSNYWRRAEIPLSLLPAQTLSAKSYTGFQWRMQRNADVRGKLLEVGAMAADLGLGMHSMMQVAFELPPSSRTFSGTVGLARAVGSGGCVDVQVATDGDAATPLWKRENLRGTDGPVKVGPVQLPADAKRLILTVAFAHDHRPPEADPLDIRDQVNWLLPLVTIDPAALPDPMRELDRHAPVLAGWTITAGADQDVRLGLHWDRQRGRWDAVVQSDAKPYTLTRRITVPSDTAALKVTVARADDMPGADILVQVAGQTNPLHRIITRFVPDDRDIASTINLKDFAGQTIDITLTVMPGEDQNTMGSLAWRGLGIVDTQQPPASP